MLTYNVKLTFNQAEDKNRLMETLQGQQFAFNEASKVHFGKTGKVKNSIVELHSKFYGKFRKKYPTIPADIVVSSLNDCLAKYRSVKSNKHKITEPIVKRGLSCHLNKNLCKFIKQDKSQIKITAIGGKRVVANLQFYPKVLELLGKYEMCHPNLFAKQGEIWLGLTFKTEEKSVVREETAIGIDLGVNRLASTSAGIILRDKQYLKRRRATRFLKRQLQSAIHVRKSQSAKRKLKRLKRREARQSNAFCHALCNKLLDTLANVLVIEDLAKLKRPCNKKKQLSRSITGRIAQMPFFRIRQILTYKAPLRQKRVEVINPAFTSQIDWRNGQRTGKRQGSRYYGKDGVVLDADLNAANNIALRSKLPVSSLVLCQALDGQATVNSPNVRDTARFPLQAASL